MEWWNIGAVRQRHFPAPSFHHSIIPSFHHSIIPSFRFPFRWALLLLVCGDQEGDGLGLDGFVASNGIDAFAGLGLEADLTGFDT